MRFMMLMKATEESEAGVMPSAEAIAEMGRYNEELVKAGVMLAGEGLHPSSRGARVGTGPDGKRTVTDGPFAETKELIAGFWMIQAASWEEALEWARRVPEGEVELRQIFEISDFPEQSMTPENAEREERLREEVQRQHSGA
ncbi:YciI family protein [Streptomyces sodiiphilus]|uniref:YciI family protein n=1 Tax=Streptomyces sodiiphilus TaxID=226217 RepID=A0ABN2PPT9_9ACTN